MAEERDIGACAVRWPPRISKRRLRQLYQSIPSGILNEEVLDVIAELTKEYAGRAAPWILGFLLAIDHPRLVRRLARAAANLGASRTASW